METTLESCSAKSELLLLLHGMILLHNMQGGVVEIGAPTGRWQLIIAYRGKHDPLDLTYLAALQHLMPEFEDLSVDVVAVSADTRNKACAFVDDLRGAVLAVSPDTKAARISFKICYGLTEQQMYENLSDWYNH